MGNTTLKDPHHVQQTLANGPIGEINVITFTQVIARAEETIVGGVSAPALDTVVVTRVAMTTSALKDLVSTLDSARVGETAPAGTA